MTHLKTQIIKRNEKYPHLAAWLVIIQPCRQSLPTWGWPRTQALLQVVMERALIMEMAILHRQLEVEYQVRGEVVLGVAPLALPVLETRCLQTLKTRG